MPPPKGMSVWAWIGIGVAALVGLAGVITAADSSVERTRRAGQPKISTTTPAPRADEASPAPTPPPPAAPAPVSVGAEQLRKEYEANEIAADERYRGHELLVTGIVKAIRKDFLDEPVVELSTSHDFMGVHVRFAPGDNPVLGKLLRGDRIIVRCVGNNVVMGSPQLKDCEIRQHARRAAAPSE